MKTLRQTTLPIVAGLLFAVSAVWIFFNRLNGLFFSMAVIPSYILLVIALFTRHRNYLLTVSTVPLLLLRLWIVNYYRTAPFPESSQQFVPYWTMVAAVYLIATVLLLVYILVNVTPRLKKYRPSINPFWFVPGAMMLAGIVVYCAMLTVLLNMNPINALLAGIFSLNSMSTPLADAFGTLILPLWLKLCAPDDLKPYEDMVGRVITPEQIEEKRRELGLVKKNNGVCS